jgi:thermitase
MGHLKFLDQIQFKYAIFISLSFFVNSAWAAPDFIPGEVLIKFRSTTSIRTRRQMISNQHGTKIRDLNQQGLTQIQLDADQTVEEAVETFRRNSEIEFAQPNYIYKMSSVPNDPKYNQLWGLNNLGQTVATPPGSSHGATSFANPGTPGRDMGLESAWNLITDCSSVVVAIVDTGVAYSHQDLAGNMWNGGTSFPKHGYDFVTNTADPMDENGHGTHVAGTIGAVGNNQLGSTGICWKAKIMAIKALDATGSGSTSTVVQGINFAVNNGAKVINLSLGTTGADSAMKSAIANAGSKQVLVVAAAGNDGADNDNSSTPSYPCNFPESNILCVAALDQNYNLASFSNYGKTNVDVGAPGVNILSPWPFSSSSISDGLQSGWNRSSTTSTGWDYGTVSLDSVPSGALKNPSNYSYQNQTYVNNTDDRIWKSFNLAGTNAVSATLSFFAQLDLSNGDYFKCSYNPAGADPFLNGTEINSETNEQSNRMAYLYSLDITPCITSNCAIGFRLTSDSSIASYGIRIALFDISLLSPSTSAYDVIEGTSMATPHVSALGAMLMAYNPSFSVQDVVSAIKNGGTDTAALAGKTTTGKSVHALGSLTYIQPPTGVTAVKK